MNTPTNIFTARIHTLESIRSILENMEQQRLLDLDQVNELLQPDLKYYVIHNIHRQQEAHKQYLVQGDSLSIFIQDYIQPGLGDGLDMHVFPQNGEWCLIFDIDGSILYKSRC